MNENFKNALANAAGFVATNKKEGCCINCSLPGEANCYSAAGKAEFKISGLCEHCFDDIVKNKDDDYPDTLDDMEPVTSDFDSVD